MTEAVQNQAVAAKSKKAPKGQAAAPAEPYTGQLKIRRLRAEAEFRHETKELPREERARYSNVVWNLVRMDMGPRSTITDMVGTDQNRDLDPKDESALMNALEYYHRKGDTEMLIKVLKFWSCYLLQLARKEPQQGKQLFLVFKAVDLLRMISQHSAHSINTEAESIIFQIFIDLSAQLPRFQNYLENENKIFVLMKHLSVNPGEHRSRLLLAQFFVKQTMFIDALIQYDTLLKLYPRVDPAVDTNRAMVHVKMGELFENLLHQVDEKLQDARKLKNFIDRYNRAFATKGLHIKPIAGANRKQILDTRTSVYRIAHHWFDRALQVKKLDRATLARLAMKHGEYLMSRGQHAQALAHLMEANEKWPEMKQKPTPDDITGRLRFLRLMGQCATKVKNKGVADWAKDEASRMQGARDHMLRVLQAKRRRMAEDLSPTQLKALEDAEAKLQDAAV